MDRKLLCNVRPDQHNEIKILKGEKQYKEKEEKWWDGTRTCKEIPFPTAKSQVLCYIPTSASIMRSSKPYTRDITLAASYPTACSSTTQILLFTTCALLVPSFLQKLSLPQRMLWRHPRPPLVHSLPGFPPQLCAPVTRPSQQALEITSDGRGWDFSPV